MRRWILVFAATFVAGCAAPPPHPAGVDSRILSEVREAEARKPAAHPPAVTEAVLPPLRMEMPEARGAPIDQRFDLVVANASAPSVFMSIVSGTRYSMLLHPNVTGAISVNLKDVTIHEALEAIRELYGYDYKVEGTRIFVHPAGLQTRVFQVNYLLGQRQGLSDVRVQSGSVADISPTAGAAAPGAAAPTTGIPTGATPSRSLESSRVQTRVETDFWRDLRSALVAIVGSAEGRQVVVTPQSGVVVVRAMPHELRAVEEYLRATRLSVERQVMLEAKIVEVTLSEGFQSGVNWALFRNSGPDVAVGQITGGSAAARLGTSGQTLSGGAVTSADLKGRSLAAAATGAFAGSPAGAVFGLAFQTSNFAALLAFLESQGSVQVLSSPRVATLNNQKAVLKVGTDEFFVTNVQTTTTTTGTATQVSPSVTVQPFFSGIALDVTPQIDEANNIILHIHPSISEVSESRREVNLGTGTGFSAISLPLARSTVSETDTIVRVTDGNIVAIGGLMSYDTRSLRGGLPGAPEGALGALLRNTDRSIRKKELVILLKPTIILGDRIWEREIGDTRRRLEQLGTPAGERRNQ
jgi:MSHA biogenesis protein MshL